MDCKEAEKLIQPYVQGNMPEKEMEPFISHIRKCHTCHEELETYFIVHEVTHQLDDDSSDSVLDFKKLLEQDIRKSRRYIHNRRCMQLAGGTLTILLSGILIIFLVFVIFEIKRFW